MTPAWAQQCTVPTLLPSFAQAALPPPGTTAATAEYIDTEGEISELRGAVILRQGQRLASADSMRIDATQTTMEGNAALREGDQEIAGTQVITNGDDLQVRSARYRRQSEAFILSVESEALARNNGELSLDHVSLSTCAPEERLWHLDAQRVEITANGQGRAYGVTLRVGDVPVLYTPIFAFNASGERQSGFLTPTIRYDSDSGAGLEIPWYGNIAPNLDTTLTPVWFNTGALALHSEWRYLNELGTWTVTAQIDDAEQWYARLNHRGRLGESDPVHTRLVWTDAQPESFEAEGEFDDDLLYRQASVRWRNAELFVEQSLANAPDTTTPYHAEPGVALSWLARSGPVRHQFRVGAERLSAPHLPDSSPPNIETGQRQWWDSHHFMFGSNAAFDWQWGLSLRATEQTFADSLSFSSAQFSVDIERQWEWGPVQFTPRLQWVSANSQESNALRVIDTDYFAPSYASLFSPRRFTGQDRASDAQVLSAGFDVRGRHPEHLLSAWRLYAGWRDAQRAESSTLPAHASGDFRGVLGSSLRLAHLDLSTRQDWRDDAHTPYQDSYAVGARLGTLGTVRASRIRGPTLDTQDTLSWNVNINAHWAATLRASHKPDLEQAERSESLRLRYRSCCASTSVTYSQSRSDGSEDEWALSFSLALTGLGEYGITIDDEVFDDPTQ